MSLGHGCHWSSRWWFRALRLGVNSQQTVSKNCLRQQLCWHCFASTTKGLALACSLWGLGVTWVLSPITFIGYLVLLSVPGCVITLHPHVVPAKPIPQP